jgi:hypothetical protein
MTLSTLITLQHAQDAQSLRDNLPSPSPQQGETGALPGNERDLKDEPGKETSSPSLAVSRPG